MKKPPFILILIVIAVMANAQEPDSIFDLKNYKTTNYERSSLGLQFNLDQGSNNIREQLESQQLETQNAKNFRGNIYANTEYSKIIFTEKKVVSYGGNFSLSQNYSNDLNKVTTITPTTIKTIQFNGSDQLSGYYSLNSYYSASNRNYFLLGGNVSLGLNHLYQKIESDNITSSEDKLNPHITSELSVKLGHGHGRIENVEDAVEAMYILNDLAIIGLLTRKYTESDVKILADKITLLYKERYYDIRLFKQKSMKELTALLRENNLILHESIDVFNILADYHLYIGFDERQSGHQMEYYFTPGLSFETQQMSEVQTNKTSTKNVGLVVRYTQSNPLSIKWQKNFNARLSVTNNWETFGEYYISNPDSNLKTSTTNLSGLASVSCSMGYFPNTRTNFNAGVNIQGGYSHTVIADYTETNPVVVGNINIGGNYYLSERLRLSGSLNVYSLYNGQKEVNNLNTSKSTHNSIHESFNLELIYYIF